MKCSGFLKAHFPILVIGLISQVIFFSVALHFKAIYISDSEEYFYQAANLKNHGSWYCWEWKEPFLLQMWSLRTPLYGYLIYLIQKISESHFAILLFQNLLSFVNFAGLVWLLKEVQIPKKLLYLILICSIVFYPTRLVYTNMVMSELVFETLLFWSFFVLIFYAKQPKPVYLLVFNMLLALAVLTKPVLVYFWLPNLALMAFLAWKNKTFRPVVYGMLMPLMIIGLSFYNQQITGYFHFSSIKTYNLYDYNTKILLTYLHGPEAAEKTITGLVKPDSFYPGLKEKWTYLEAECFKIIKQNLGLYTFLHARGMVNFFLDPGRYDLYYFLPPLQTKTEISFFNSYREKGLAGIMDYFSKLPVALTIYMALIMLWNVITTIGLIWFVFSRKFALEIRIFTFLLVGYICAASGIIGCARFKEPVYFLLLFATVLVAGQYFQRRKNSISLR